MFQTTNQLQFDRGIPTVFMGKHMGKSVLIENPIVDSSNVFSDTSICAVDWAIQTSIVFSFFSEGPICFKLDIGESHISLFEPRSISFSLGNIMRVPMEDVESPIMRQSHILSQGKRQHDSCRRRHKDWELKLRNDGTLRFSDSNL